MARKGRASLGIGMIGTKFMGRAHSVGWAGAGKFFDLALRLDRACVAGRDAAETHEFARRWEWQRSTADWRSLIGSAEVDLVDICTPNHCHAEMAIAALAAGKCVACEKPLAGTLSDARRMAKAAKAGARRGLKTFVWFNYRRCPAVALAHLWAKSGRLGKIRHVRATYLQDWGGPSTPLLWRFQADQAGSGAHGDLNAHIVDMARFITGCEVTEVTGAIAETFVKRRTVVSSTGGAISGSKARKSKRGAAATGASTVDDCVLFLARMEQGIVASFEATRLATGNKNRNTIEINGDRGSIKFDFERMNELEWWDDSLPQEQRGWSRVMCTEAVHPYAHAYWPSAHLIGYEHTFVSQCADIARALSGASPEVPLCDFEDALRTQAVLDAALRSARLKRAVEVPLE